MATIIVSSGEKQGDYYPLGRRTNVVGRGEQLPIQILDDKVSRKHVQIRYDGDRGRYFAIDLGSKHGVFINGRRVEEETCLKDRDEIRIGDTVLLFTEEEFSDLESAMRFYKKAGERNRPTVTDT